MDETNLIELIVKYHGDLEGIAAALDASLEVLLQGYAIMTIDKTRIPQLYTYTQIEHIEIPKRLSFEQTAALQNTCTEVIHNSPIWDLRGEGVIVAVIDSGLDYLHPDFRNADGSTRIRYIWDQTATSGTPPKGFIAGAEYDREEINAALRSENPRGLVPYRDSNGHGTAVTGIAAGNGRSKDGQIVGMAPEADIISVRLGSRGYECFARTTELMRAIKYVIERARQLEEPVAINISFGMNNGSHRGDSLFEAYMNDISVEWKCVIVSPTGNEGSAGHHQQVQLKSRESKDIEFFTAPGIRSFFVTMWKDFADTFSVELLLPGGRSSGVVNADNQIKQFRSGNLEIRITYGQPSHYSLAQQIYIEVDALEGTIDPGLWIIRLASGEIVNGKVDLWLPSLEAVSSQTFFSESNSENTLTIPSTARKIITVAGYQDRTNSVLDFSGRGTTDDWNQKPDLAAPASNIMAASDGGGYDTFTGTSFAAPFVTGAAALMMQWGIVRQNDPFLYGERVKAFLRLGATRSSIRRYPNINWGYGTLCLERTMEQLIKYKLGGVKEFWLVM